MKELIFLAILFFCASDLFAIQKVFLSDRGTQKVLITNDILDTSGSTQTKTG